MAKVNLAVKISYPWWANIYIAALNAFARMHGLQPDVDKCAKLITRHCKIEVVNGEK